MAAHWFAERQTGPSLLNFGTEEQRLRLLPAIARGECFTSIGLSEPDSGSDLASIRTSGRKVDGGWVINGNKVWTSHANRSHFMVTLCRTGRLTSDRHDGLTQFIIDLQAPGIEIRPIKLLNGHGHFAEVLLDDVFVDDSMLLGEVGRGWQQVNVELAFERSGPERFLSTYPLLTELAQLLVDTADANDEVRLGSLVANLWNLREMCIFVAKQLDRGLAPQLEASLVKVLGTEFENDVVDLAALYAPEQLLQGTENVFKKLLNESILSAPSFTLRGGTTEILRGIISREVLA